MALASWLVLKLGFFEFFLFFHVQEKKVAQYGLVPIKTVCSCPQSAFMLGRGVVIVHALARGSQESAQAVGKSELRVNVCTNGFTRSCQTGPWGGVGE